MTQKPVDLGQFPPCPGVTSDEVLAIRTLTKYGDDVFTSDEHLNAVLERDQHILDLLGRVGNWCRAYQERIGLGEAD